MSTPILLTTLNAKYQHASFGLRYLYANLGKFQEKTKIVEFTINQNPKDIAEAILAEQPKIVGMGVYIWNTRPTLEVIEILKKVCPEIVIILGGPEVSHETESQLICQMADFTIKGEADLLFYEFCLSYFDSGILPTRKWISGKLPDVKKLNLPYSFYSDNDIKNRVIYVEASRGCPYKCEYCLSSLDKSVRSFDLSSFLSEMDRLVLRGARQFKFVDRTFNLSISTSTQILQFFLDRIHLGLFLHFEMVPDRLPEELRMLIKRFPPGSLQFEVGIQTWNPDVAKLVSRRQDYSKIQENFKFLSSETGVHTHADLIAGLPGETLESFAQGFDAVYCLKPDEIQLGILKRLKGTPIIRHDIEWEMKYQDTPPFQILQTKTMSYRNLQELNRFSQFWNLIANSGHFKKTMKLIEKLAHAKDSQHPSLFWEFYHFSQFLYSRHPQGNGIALLNLLESTWIYLSQHDELNLEEVRNILIEDYTGKVSRDIPYFLRTTQKENSVSISSSSQATHLPKRQLRHHSYSVPGN